MRWTPFVVVVVMAGAPVARAADLVIPPGTTYALTADIEMAKGDNVLAGGPGARCTIAGNGFNIVTAEGFTGRFVIQNCDVTGLGSAEKLALHVRADATASIVIEDDVFDASGQLRIATLGMSTASVRGNVFKETMLIPTVTAEAMSAPVFRAEGFRGMGRKVFQRNQILRSWALFQRAQNWLIGGDPGEGNVIVGVRGGIHLELSSDIVVRGNYMHNIRGGDGWNQVKNLNVINSDNVIAEHNVIYYGNWLVDFGGSGELRYNLLIDSVDRPWVIGRSDKVAKIHHNVMLRTQANLSQALDGLHVDGPNDPTMGGKLEFFNNTMDGGGPCRPPASSAISITAASFLHSLRSNAMFNIPIERGANSAAVRGRFDEAKGTPPLERLGYADYNLFYNPNSLVIDNYALTVAGKMERLEAGFALNDATKGGPIDQQVAPVFADRIPTVFAFDDERVKAGTVTVCQILAYYRRIYTPGAGSPLIDAGDPADGAGNDIGAVGAGAAHADDLFGRYCPGDDVGTPVLGPDAYKCDPRPVGGMGGAGGGTGGMAGGMAGAGGTTGMVPPGRGVVCVCDVGTTSPPGAAGIGGLLLAVALVRRRRH